MNGANEARPRLHKAELILRVRNQSLIKEMRVNGAKAVYRRSPVGSSWSPRKKAEAVKGAAEPREEETENREL